MDEKPKRQPVQNQIIAVRVAAILGLIALILGLGMLVKIPDARGVERPILEILYMRLMPPAPIVFNGENWEMLINVNRILDENGNELEQEYSHRVVLEMHSDGTTVYGSYISASQTVCSNADFSGTIDGNTISWVVQYKGSCCPTARMEFTGEIDESRQRIDGQMQPTGIPPENCWIWWADVTMFEE